MWIVWLLILILATTIHSPCTPCPASALNSKDQHTPFWSSTTSKKGTIPSNIHVLQQSDAIVTILADTIRPLQRTIYNSATTVCNDKQQSCGHQSKTDHCRVAHS